MTTEYSRCNCSEVCYKSGTLKEPCWGVVWFEEFIRDQTGVVILTNEHICEGHANGTYQAEPIEAK